MPPKRSSKRTVAAVSSDPVRSGSDPGSFQLPPYREDRPSLWFINAEGQMDMRNIIDPYYRVILVQTALSYAQQDAVAHILVKAPTQPAEAYQLLKTELLRLHEQSEWDRLQELLALPALGGQKGSELMATIERLTPADHTLWPRYQFLARLPADMQRQLAEDKSSNKQLAARVDELQRKAPKAAAAAHITAATPAEEVVAAAHAKPPRTPWKKQRSDNSKRRRSKDGQGGHGGGGAAKKQKSEPWVDAGICRFHWRYGDDAYRCEKPCTRSGN